MRGRRDIGEAREVKEHSSKAGDLGESQRWTKVVLQRKRRYGEELGRGRYREETTSEDSDKEEEKEVSKVDRDQVWPGTSGKANRRSVRHITEPRSVNYKAMTLSWARTLRARSTTAGVPGCRMAGA